MSSCQVNQTFLDRFKVVSPSSACIGRKHVVMYPVSESKGQLKLFSTKDEAESFKQQQIAEYLAPKPKPKPLPTPTSSITELDQLSNKIAK